MLCRSAALVTFGLDWWLWVLVVFLNSDVSVPAHSFWGPSSLRPCPDGRGANTQIPRVRTWITAPHHQLEASCACSGTPGSDPRCSPHRSLVYMLKGISIVNAVPVCSIGCDAVCVGKHTKTPAIAEKSEEPPFFIFFIFPFIFSFFSFFHVFFVDLVLQTTSTSRLL